MCKPKLIQDLIQQRSPHTDFKSWHHGAPSSQGLPSDRHRPRPSCPCCPSPTLAARTPHLPEIQFGLTGHHEKLHEHPHEDVLHAGVQGVPRRCRQERLAIAMPLGRHRSIEMQHKARKLEAAELENSPSDSASCTTRSLVYDWRRNEKGV
jgi:hypothetical protein